MIYIVSRPALRIDLRGLEPGREDVGLFDQMLEVLRFARYWAAFPQLKSDVEPVE